MKIFVTGGSGFIGSHIIETLVKSEHEVFAMARSERSADVVESYGATAVRCSLDDISADHLMGCDAVVHSAAFVEEWGTREQFWEGNVMGTTHVLAAAKSAGVKTFVHIGTEAAFFVGKDLHDLNEDHPYPVLHKYLYSVSKAEAERRVLSADEIGFRTVSLRPRMVWGPRDAAILPAILKMANQGGWRWIDGGRPRTSTTHVLNVAHAVELILEKGRAGEAYFVADERRSTIHEFISDLVATQGVSLPQRSIQGWLARGVANVAEMVWRVLRIKSTPPITRFAAGMMSRTITIDYRKAVEQLGYAPVISYEQGMADLRLDHEGSN